MVYCKFGNFRENFIFANSVKRHICDAQKLRTYISNQQRGIAISRGFYFRETSHINAKFHENKTLAKISEFTVVSYHQHQ